MFVKKQIRIYTSKRDYTNATIVIEDNDVHVLRTKYGEYHSNAELEVFIPYISIVTSDVEILRFLDAHGYKTSSFSPGGRVSTLHVTVSPECADYVAHLAELKKESKSGIVNRILLKEIERTRGGE